MCDTEHLAEALGRGVKARKHHAPQGQQTSVWVHALNKEKSQAVTEELYSSGLLTDNT